MKDLIATVLFVLTLFAMLACIPREQCPTIGTYRCSGHTVQYCADSNEWYDVSTCGKVTTLDGDVEEWTCCVVDGGAECVDKCEQ